MGFFLCTGGFKYNLKSFIKMDKCGLQRLILTFIFLEI